jgi:hypothetical protein
MEMGVILQGTSPGVEDAEESWEITADVVFVEGEFFDGLGGGLEQGRVSHPDGPDKGDVGSNTTLYCKRKDLNCCSPMQIPVQTEIDIVEWEE